MTKLNKESIILKLIQNKKSCCRSILLTIKKQIGIRYVYNYILSTKISNLTSNKIYSSLQTTQAILNITNQSVHKNNEIFSAFFIKHILVLQKGSVCWYVSEFGLVILW